MSDVQRVTLGVLPKNSVPDPILFIFNNPEGEPRNLSGPEWSFIVVIKKGETGTPTAYDGTARIDNSEATQGKIRYEWSVDDLNTPESVKVQMIAQKTVGEEITRRHISDIAVINVASSPASTHLIEPT